MKPFIPKTATKRSFAAIIGLTLLGVATFQTTAQPIALSIERSANAAMISWPTNGVGFALQSSTNLVTWANVGSAPIVVNGRNVVTQSISQNNQVFRLSNGGIFSVNAVGYFNLQVAANRMVLFANPLDTTNNSIAALLADVPANTILYRYCDGCSPTNSASWKAASYCTHDDDDQILSWGQAGSETLSPGAGAILRNTTATPFVITFIGEVPQGTRTNPLAAGYSLKASIFPLSDTLPSLLFPADDGDVVMQYSGTSFLPFFYDGGGGFWDPMDPVLSAGEAFWLATPSARSWTRTFIVTP